MSKFHVVCHDCTFEGIYTESAYAEAYTVVHRNDTEHNVEYAEVDNA